MVVQAFAGSCPAVAETQIVARKSDGAGFVMLGGSLHHIPDNATLRALWPDAPASPAILSDLCVQVIGTGEPLPSVSSVPLADLVAVVNELSPAALPPGPAPVIYSANPSAPATAGQSSAGQGGIFGILGNLGGDFKAHEKAILIGGAALGAFYFGIPQRLLGGRHRRY